MAIATVARRLDTAAEQLDEKARPMDEVARVEAEAVQLEAAGDPTSAQQWRESYVGRDPVEPGEIDPEYVDRDHVGQLVAPVQDPMPMEDPAPASYESGESSFGYEDASSDESTDPYTADSDDTGSW